MSVRRIIGIVAGLMRKRKTSVICPNCGRLMKVLDDFDGCSCYNCGFWISWGIT